MKERKFSVGARHGVYKHIPSVEDHDEVALRSRRKAAKFFSLARAEFSRRFAAASGWPSNPRWLSPKQVELIHAQPQWIDPHGCPRMKRLFDLEAVPV